MHMKNKKSEELIDLIVIKSVLICFYSLNYWQSQLLQFKRNNYLELGNKSYAI